MNAEHREHAKAPRAVVWEVLKHSAGYADWGMWESSVVERPAEGPDPDGVGSVRILKVGRRTLREEIVTFEPPERLAYAVHSGIFPAKDYLGTVTLTEQGDGTEIHWHSEFGSSLPFMRGPLEKGFTKVLREVAQSVAREAERRAGAA